MEDGRIVVWGAGVSFSFLFNFSFSFSFWLVGWSFDGEMLGMYIYILVLIVWEGGEMVGFGASMDKRCWGGWGVLRCGA